MARAPIMCRKERGGFFPADAYASQQYDAIPEGKELSVRVSVMSSTGKTEREGNRGLWWAGLHLLAENCDDPEYDTDRKAHEAILFALGFVRPRFRIDGSIVMDVVSTSEEAMDDEEFSVLMRKADEFIERKFGWNPWESWKLEQEAAKANQQGSRR